MRIKSLRMLDMVCVTAAVSITGCVTSITHGKATARIHSVQGPAQVARGTGGWEEARLWQNLHAGDRARTSGHGTIDFTLGQYGGVLTLMPESAIEFEQIGPSTPDSAIVAVINLTEGRVVGDTLKLPANKRIQIKTHEGLHEIP